MFRVTKWYVEAMTGQTNEVIAAELPSENAHRGVLCKDGETRNFWECDYPFISKLLKNKEDWRLEFKVFYREGIYGPIRLWPFLETRRVPLAEALKKRIISRGRR